MSTTGGAAGAPSPSDREQIEADVTGPRLVELEIHPVQGRFDAAHLREVNRRIFQDMPARGFHDVTPGQYRPAAPEGQDWLKNRALTTVRGTFLVAYSSMDAAAQQRIEAVLQGAKPQELARLDQAAFTKKIAGLYAELDYLHPFSDGNSRTLRTFTKQLARESGYVLDWARFSLTPQGRDALYIARDLSVNAIALPKMVSHRAMVGVSHAMDSLAANPDLEAILEGAIRPIHDQLAERTHQVGARPVDQHRKNPREQEFERAMDERRVPDALRPQLRQAFIDELQARVARGELPAQASADRPTKATPADVVDPAPTIRRGPKR